MIARKRVLAATLLAAGLIWCAAAIQVAHSQPTTTREVSDEGKHVFQHANCIGCHKWHGNGGGGYGGDALSLRKTELSREQIIEVISCGRPGTGMPAFARDAYAGRDCYGMAKQDLESNPLAKPQAFLRPPEVDAVADYVLAHVKGKGEPSYDDCVEFFGEGSRVCNVYKQQSSSPAGAAESAHP
jgi:hypothetical protein